jgi:pimeloyl-ACP methyl ester carboxylesterase
MTMCHAEVNGIKIALDIHGSGPALILIMGYRLSSRAWPLDFIEALAERFTVVLFDNRGTGLSDKPIFGYGLTNMARMCARSVIRQSEGVEGSCWHFAGNTHRAARSALAHLFRRI